MPRTLIPQAGANRKVAEHNLYDFRQIARTTGNIWFVDSGASASGSGLSPEDPVTTIDAAINLATASNGDVIFVMEGHAETITGAAGVDQDKIGLRIIGLGQGSNRPTITFGTANGASWDIDAAGCLMENIVLVNAKDGQTAMVNITAADVTVRNCLFRMGDACTQAVLGILTTDGADRLTIEDCNFFGPAAAGVTAAIRIVGTDHTIVRRNVVLGHFAATGAIEQTTTAGNLHVYDGNTVLNLTADGNNKALVLKSDTTAIIVNNRLAVIDSTCPAPWTAGAGYFGGNYHVAAVDTAGTLR